MLRVAVLDLVAVACHGLTRTILFDAVCTMNALDAVHAADAKVWAYVDLDPNLPPPPISRLR